MNIVSHQAQYVLTHPGAFALQTVKAFRANQGLLLAGAVAYYALLSLVPLLILVVIALSHLIDEKDLLETLGRYLEWLLPSHGPVFRKDDRLIDRTIARLESYLHMADFGTCAIDWPLMDQWERELVDGKAPQ